MAVAVALGKGGNVPRPHCVFAQVIDQHRLAPHIITNSSSSSCQWRVPTKRRFQCHVADAETVRPEAGASRRYQRPWTLSANSSG